ncbi:hypothetical protein PPTG_05951 [Phytophthora nicotianae INRA-310]|uniref:Uncharacterized protein n=1 Tax=Phytophthora nicotianae (strain INRA-310) TaxID=761204 RepID=W2QUJ9_PHYN3|nr:hypothetical protein PPTG_05951 [Phytophthora nicotianae INRA-310]ETN16857.1 hypothetical protein PPTG_05951 [Phytophthora nicotianae INRA-310]
MGVPLYHSLHTTRTRLYRLSEIGKENKCPYSRYAILQGRRISLKPADIKTRAARFMTHGLRMDAGDTRRRCSLGERRSRRRRSSSSSCSSSSSSDSSDRFSHRYRRSSCRTSRPRSRSPRKFEDCHGYRRRSRSRDSLEAAQRGARFAARRVHHKEERESRRSTSRRIAPNATALKSIMLGTARSRDRMDELEQARAKEKLASLDTANTLAQ